MLYYKVFGNLTYHVVGIGETIPQPRTFSCFSAAVLTYLHNGAAIRTYMPSPSSSQLESSVTLRIQMFPAALLAEEPSYALLAPVALRVPVAPAP